MGLGFGFGRTVAVPGAVSFVSFASGIATTATSITVPITIGSITNGALFAFVAIETNGPNDDYASGVTWNGVALSAIAGTDFVGATSRSTSIQAFRILSPAAGSFNLVASVAAAPFSWGMGAYVLQGVHQTTPTGTPDGGGNAAGSGETLSGTAVATSSLILLGAANAVETEAQEFSAPTGTLTEDLDVNCGSNGVRLTVARMAADPVAWSAVASNNGGFRHASTAFEVRAA